MKKHWKYLKYILRHKWYVFKAGLYYRVWWHQLILHDWSKFTPLEWKAYANYFWGVVPTTEQLENSGLSRSEYIDMMRQETVKLDFKYAWNHHQKVNKHHWQYWVMHNDNGSHRCLPMPERFVREMVADWTGAGMAISGVDDTVEWYYKNRHKMLLNPVTRKRVHELLCIPAEMPFINDEGHTEHHLAEAGV